MQLSKDALIFGFAYLSHSKSTLQFGGYGTEMKITPRARAALTELLDAGAVEVDTLPPPSNGREYYKGKIPIGPLMKGVVDPFSEDAHWASFISTRYR